MVTCEFLHRTGNNLFQIAITYAMADKYNDFAQFPPYPYFNLPARTHPIQNKFHEPVGRNLLIDIPYRPNMSLIGWFQRHERFDFIREKLIKKVFKIPDNPIKDTIGIQIRRGDFLQDPVNFPTQPDQYYLNALNEIRYQGKQIVFCSDDIPYCKSHFGKIPNVSFREKVTPVQDIEFMANCESLIISNSTMGFWGAYLSLRDRIIIYPHNWFSKMSGRDGSEICLNEWRKR
jgi:hypothetical protein